ALAGYGATAQGWRIPSGLPGHWRWERVPGPHRRRAARTRAEPRASRRRTAGLRSTSGPFLSPVVRHCGWVVWGVELRRAVEAHAAMLVGRGGLRDRAADVGHVERLAIPG